MANALLGLHLQIEPTTSQFQLFPAKAEASRKRESCEPRIRCFSSSSRSASGNRRKLRSIETSVSSIKTLLNCINSGCLKSALQLFETMTKPSTFVWNVVIRGLVDSGLFEEAIEFYFRMQFEGIKADNFTFPFVIKACAGVLRLQEGPQVHSSIIKLGYDKDVYICNALIVMYAKVGHVEYSEKVFELMPIRDIVSWNSMISGYVSAGDGLSSLLCFQEMQRFGLKLDRFSYISALGACALEGCLLRGKEIFCQVLRNGLELDSMIQSSLIDMFGKCGEVDYSERICDCISQRNIVVWNAMIGAYTLNEKPFKSFSCIKKMQNDDNVKPDVITLINLLPSCSKLGALLKGKEIHGHAIRKGYFHHLVLETSLVDMYGKCGSVTLAERAFYQMKEKNLISWNAIIAAYVQNSGHREAIETFLKILQYEPCVPDEMTFVSILSAYAEIALPNEGKQIHSHIYKLGFSFNTFIYNALIHMYVKCGDLDSSRKVFDIILFKDIISWNTIIMAYAIHGFGSYCFELFSDMMNKGNDPNGSTFVSLLSACSIAGLADEGWKYFNLMKRDFGIDPGIEHYGCMIDLLGRIGDFDSAITFIEEMPVKPTPRIWGSLLAASRHHKNIEVAEMAASKIISLDNKNDKIGCYVLLSNLYAKVGRWEDVKRVESLMKKLELERTAACSIAECKGKTYKFSNHDRSRGESIIIYDVLDILSRKIGEDLCSNGVYKFKPANLLRKRANSPACHSVRLAVCFGLIGTSIGNPVVVRKNVRICEDCHIAVRKFSKVTNREIVVGDSKIYHRFKNGRCSCGDYW